MQVAVIGAGTIFEDHVRACRELGVPIAGVADVDAERAARAAAAHDIPFHTAEWRDLLDKTDAAAVSICTPPRCHRDMVLEALRAGRHVICEKPLALSLAEVDEIVRAAEEASGKLTVVHQLRYKPALMRLKWLADGNHLGPIRFARCLRYDPPPTHLVNRGVWGAWDLAGGGVLLTKAIHQVDLLCWLLGRPRRVEAMMGTFLYPIESEDHVTANIEFESGALASLCVSANPHGFVEQLDLVGERGAAGIPWKLSLAARDRMPEIIHKLEHRWPLGDLPWRPGWQARLGRLAVRLKRRVGLLPPWRDEGGHTPLFREFLAAVQGNAPIPVTAAESRVSFELCAAIYTSAICGSPVELPLDGSSRFYRGITRDDYHAAKAR